MIKVLKYILIRLVAILIILLSVSNDLVCYLSIAIIIGSSVYEEKERFDGDKHKGSK